MKNKIVFFLIILSAFFIRICNINWDQGFHLHPDERMLIMVADRINFFKNLNPNFFNYGSLPIYLLKGIAQFLGLGNYNDMLYLGRFLSIIADIITVFLVYKVCLLLFKNKRVALFSSFFYSVAFFPIQNSHFFVVDVFLNTFVTGLIYMLLIYLKSPSIKKTIILGLVFAAMMAAKFTAIIFFPIIISVILWKTMKQWNNLTISLITFNLSFLTFYFFFMPYAFIENIRFIADIKAQLKMNSNPYIFPYTLQYVGSLPYLYYLKNIFFWGLGPIISILSLIGLGLLSLRVKRGNFFLFLIFYILYFLIVGRSAVKFMRYMLPLYPFFTILAGYGLYQVYRFYKLFFYPLLLLCLLWSFMFTNIYSFPHTRISATDWILKNIPKGSTLAIEHWDDRLPLYRNENYKFKELTLYDQPDDETKWQVLNEKLKRTDYIIIASNRLYIPLQKLSDCKKYKVCYPKTAEYYRKLFSGKLDFRKVAEFDSYPTLQIGSFRWVINDDSADESFTVYDHPKIMIFQKL